MNIFLTVLFMCVLVVTGCSNKKSASAESPRSVIETFQLRIRNSGVITSEIHETILSEKNIKVIQGEGKDSLKFITPVLYSDSLNRISEIDLAKLDSLYSNECIADGLQLTAVIRRGDTLKTIHISNFYQPDIGLAIEYLNSYVPEKFRITYDKKQLEEEYIKCKADKKKVGKFRDF